MNRFTENIDGYYCFPLCFNQNCATLSKVNCKECGLTFAIAEALGRYEDLGLTSSEIEEALDKLANDPGERILFQKKHKKVCKSLIPKSYPLLSVMK